MATSGTLVENNFLPQETPGLGSSRRTSFNTRVRGTTLFRNDSEYMDDGRIVILVIEFLLGYDVWSVSSISEVELKVFVARQM